MEGTVNIKSKDDYYNTERILNKWGFTDNQCHHCGVLNSDLAGLLMQCGKCKKAYYCSMKCFNEALPVHQKFCGTKEICTEPKGKKSTPWEFEDDLPTTKQSPPPPEPQQRPPPAPVMEEKEEPPKTDPDLLVHTQTSVLIEEFISDDEESVEDEVAELQNSVYSLDLSATEESSQRPSGLSHSFSDFGRGSSSRCMPDRDPPYTREEVDLRHAEQWKREYGWQTPEWVDAQLRATERGRVLRAQGDIVSPVTNAKVLIEKGIITWEAPIWTNAKLRKTPRGAEIKRTASLTDAQKMALRSTRLDSAVHPDERKQQRSSSKGKKSSSRRTKP